MPILQHYLLILLSLLIPKGFAERTSSMRACKSLSLNLPGQVSFPRDQVYEYSISSYAYIGTRLRPTCLASPRSTKDVATIIKTLSEFASVAFAIRSGGHNTNKGVYIFTSRLSCSNLIIWQASRTSKTESL
jgi:hypothetical protein